MKRKGIGGFYGFYAMICIYAYCKSKEIKSDENAMEVIQVVMLIAVGVLAISAVWAGVNGYLEKLWAMIIGAPTPGGPTLGP